MTLVILLVYLGLVLSIGLTSHRLFRGTGEDYFLATRSIGPFLLLMSLFGTRKGYLSFFSVPGPDRKRRKTASGGHAMRSGMPVTPSPLLTTSWVPSVVKRPSSRR